MIAAEPLLDAVGGDVEALVRLLGAAGRLEHDAGVEVDGAVGPEPRALALEDHVAGEAAIEIFAERVAEPLFDMGAVGVANVEILAGNAQCHGSLRTFSVVRFCRAPGTRYAAHAMVGAVEARNATDASRRKRTATPARRWAEVLWAVRRQVNRPMCIGESILAEHGDHHAAPAPRRSLPSPKASLSRRRWTEEGMRSASRYLATVRRAMSMPESRSTLTMVSSDRTASAILVVDQPLDAVADRLGRMGVAAARPRGSPR